jgi:hypothetical protein
MSRLKSPFHIESIILYRTTSFWVTYVTPPLLKKSNPTSLINFGQHGIFQDLF